MYPSRTKTLRNKISEVMPWLLFAGVLFWHQRTLDDRGEWMKRKEKRFEVNELKIAELQNEVKMLREKLTDAREAVKELSQ